LTYLLDTHVWLWMLGDPDRIRPDLAAELRESRTRLLLSAASSWEIAIKWAVGRLSLPEPPATYVPSRMQRTNVEPLAVTHSHALQVATLPRHHGDPFDRLLIAQAQLERVPLVTIDRALDAYDIETIRADRGAHSDVDV
jgi:PIN domain nuclease of toxin-antitoxin system